jgi:hydrogenase expression/formation protein HypC
MCLAVPGIIEKIDDTGVMKMSKVNFSGVYKSICIEWTPEAKVGDYVIVHAGFALNILNKEDALETLRTFDEISKF